MRCLQTNRYNSFVFVLEVFDLPVATVLESHLLAESEGSAFGYDVSLATLDKDMRDVRNSFPIANYFCSFVVN